MTKTTLILKNALHLEDLYTSHNINRSIAVLGRKTLLNLLKMLVTKQLKLKKKVTDPLLKRFRERNQTGRLRPDRRQFGQLIGTLIFKISCPLNGLLRERLKVAQLFVDIINVPGNDIQKENVTLSETCGKARVINGGKKTSPSDTYLGLSFM